MRLLIETIAGAGLTLDPDEAHELLLGKSLASMRAILARDFGLELSDAALDAMRHRLYAAFRAELAPDPRHRRDPRRAALRLLRRLLLAARAHRALADRHRPLAALRRAAPSPPPWSRAASPPPTSSFSPPKPSAILPPPAWSSRTARPA